ncbi:MAG: hypothetical protein V8T87_14185 [Victivallales bacterium]
MKIRIHVRTVVKLKLIDFAGFQLQILLETDLIDIFRSLEMNQNTAIVRLQNRFALRRLLHSPSNRERRCQQGGFSSRFSKDFRL